MQYILCHLRVFHSFFCILNIEGQNLQHVWYKFFDFIHTWPKTKYKSRFQDFQKSVYIVQARHVLRIKHNAWRFNIMFDFFFIWAFFPRQQINFPDVLDNQLEDILQFLWNWRTGFWNFILISKSVPILHFCDSADLLVLLSFNKSMMNQSYERLMEQLFTNQFLL